MFHCPHFNRHRVRLGLDFNGLVGSDEEKFVTVFHTASLDELSRLAQFVYIVLDVCEFERTRERMFN